ncbi:hypothetical protein Mapa_016695 [Marchantia paleacea]|nr:hypothetical protein Mapa_016695 [Marchantia paleacea]
MLARSMRLSSADLARCHASGVVLTGVEALSFIFAKSVRWIGSSYVAREIQIALQLLISSHPFWQ